jgi:hypothetical protein
MLAFMADFTQNDLTNWAQGQAGAAPTGDEEDPIPGAEGDPAEEESSGGDPAEVLRQAANDIEKACGVIASVTLKDGEDKAFSKRWDTIQDELEEKVTEAREMADDYEAAHEDDEDEEEPDADDEEAPKKGAGPAKDDEEDDEEPKKGKAPPFGKKD